MRSKMMNENNKKCSLREHRASGKGLTLMEMIIALAMMGIIFAAIVPMFGQIRNSWDSKQGAAETLQNGRILVDHLNRSLSKAVRITAVSDPLQTSGYIEFLDNDANNLRYDVNSTTDYVEFGYVGELFDLAGPVGKLQFTCYDACDLDTPITDVNFIRFVKVEATLTNPAALGLDKTLITSAYLRTNGKDRHEISRGTPFEYDASLGQSPALVQVDSTHYLCAYRGVGSDGWAVVLTVDNGNWTISKGTAFEFDTSTGMQPALDRIDSAHYLCVYRGPDDDGWAVVLAVDNGNWTISKGTAFEFDTSRGMQPALARIDSAHYLCAYRGPGDDGWAVVLAVDAGWTISNETPFEFDGSNGQSPALVQIDNTHYLCAYEGPGTDGWAVVLTVDTGNWTISKGTAFEFDTANGQQPALIQIDTNHYLCAYTGSGSTGRAVVLTVDTGNWTISKGTTLDFDTAAAPALAQMNASHYLCTYTGPDDDGWATVLTVDTEKWTISYETPFEFDTESGLESALVKIDNDDYLCAYAGPGSDGWAVVLECNLEDAIRP